MTVQICFQKESKVFSLKKEMTVKEATHYYKEHFEKDSSVHKVWLRYFDGWHYQVKKILKSENRIHPEAKQ